MKDDLLEQLQADVYGILSASPPLAAARIILNNEGDLEGTLEHELATTGGRLGKAGLAVIVLEPEVTSAEKNLPGPPLQAQIHVQTIELVELNRSASDGTGIRSSTAALRVLAALHHMDLGGHALYPAKTPLRPLPVRAGFVAHLVSLTVDMQGAAAAGKAAAVESAWDDGLVLTCGTPGARIYYTLDGSYPGPGNAAALQAEATLTGLTPGTRVRFAAHAPELNPGDAGELTITP